ncbi:hypothetical protein C1H46_003879 [Malus baccata]|uniref:Uncharacterized protein n=1 Tax=Malus baccata TaxID=106549 RepID=A0A540NHM4_MALBA|nr:hypothetical protein C1H46_003879 [Malus baccata]
MNSGAEEIISYSESGDVWCQQNEGASSGALAFIAPKGGGDVGHNGTTPWVASSSRILKPSAAPTVPHGGSSSASINPTLWTGSVSDSSPPTFLATNTLLAPPSKPTFSPFYKEMARQGERAKGRVPFRILVPVGSHFCNN